MTTAINFFKKIFFTHWLLFFISNNITAQCAPNVSISKDTVCESGLPYFWNGAMYTAPGMYSVTLVNSGNCDSFAILILDARASSISETKVALCINEFPFTWNGKSYTEPGIYNTLFSNSHGCDSVAKLILTSTNEWTGGAGNNNWEDAANWSCQALPNGITDVVIDSGTVVLGSNTTVRSLTVAPGATLTVNSGFNITINPTNQGTGIYLSSVLSFSSDTSTVPYASSTYRYDAAGRLRFVESTSNVGIGEPGEPSDGGPLPATTNFIYYYNTADTLPFKALQHVGGDIISEEFFTYDSQTRLTQKILTQHGSSVILDYSYLPGEITVRISSMGNVYKLLYDGNNITSTITTDLSTGFPVPPDTMQTQFTNLRNPFNLVNIYRHIPDLPIYNYIDVPGFNKNAPLLIYNNRQPNTETFQYQNIVNGLPGKKIITHNSTQQQIQHFYYSQ